jgi:hypothetical protein
LHHRPELEHAEASAALADALLREEDGTAAVEQDPERDRGQQRREQDDQERGRDAVGYALDEAAQRRTSR